LSDDPDQQDQEKQEQRAGKHHFGGKWEMVLALGRALPVEHDGVPSTTLESQVSEFSVVVVRGNTWGHTQVLREL